MEVLRNIPVSKQHVYEFIITFLEIGYGEAHLQEVYKAQLQGRRQLYNESLQKYEADIRRLINLNYPAYLEEIKQELAINSFIEGLRDPETSHTLRIARLKKTSEAFAYVLQLEIGKQTSRSQERIIRKVKLSQDYRKTNKEI